MGKLEDIERYNRRRKARITKRANMDWQDGETLDEYYYKQPEAQSYVFNPPSAPRKPIDPKAEVIETMQRLNSFRRRGNFGQLHAEIDKMPNGCAISYDCEDWVKSEDKWVPREAKPLRTIDFARKIMQDGQDVEYDPNGREKASKNTENKLRELWKAGDRGALNSMLESRNEGSTITIDGIEYRKDGYLKWCNGDSRIGSRGITKRMDAAKGKFTFNC